MKTFYRVMVALSYFGYAGLFWIISTSSLPWWKWPLLFIFAVLIEFGASAKRDAQNEGIDL